MTRLLFLALLSISRLAFAESGSHLGFYSASHLSIPPQVRKASDSVFQIIVPNLEGKSLNTFQIPSREYTALKKRFLNYKNMSATSRKVIAAQIDFCDWQTLKSCDIYLNSHAATGFFMNGALWTNAHVVESYFDQLKNPQERLLIFIFNKNDELILNPLVEPVFLQKLPVLNQRAEQRGTFYSEETDFVAFKIPKALAPSLQPVPDKNSILLSQDLYIPGFPACTNCHEGSNSQDSNDLLDRSPFPNSSGHGLHLTHGPRLSLAAAASLLEIPLDNLTRLSGQGLMFLESDSRQGMSGAPILNSQGQVIGIFSGGKTKSKNGTLSRVSRGVRVQQLLN